MCSVWSDALETKLETPAFFALILTAELVQTQGSYQHHSAYSNIFPCVWSHNLRTYSEAPTFDALILTIVWTLYESYKNF